MANANILSPNFITFIGTSNQYSQYYVKVTYLIFYIITIKELSEKRYIKFITKF